MATTSGNLVAGKVASQGGNGRDGRYGPKAKVATGLAILGCAAALAFGGAQRGDTAQFQPQAAHTATSMVDWEQAERAQVAQGQPAAVLDWEQSDRALVAPPASTAQANGRTRQLLLEQNVSLPSGGAVAVPAAPTTLGPQDYLPGEGPVGGEGNVPLPVFGPQP